jgi:hypothetical protein
MDACQERRLLHQLGHRRQPYFDPDDHHHPWRLDRVLRYYRGGSAAWFTQGVIRLGCIQSKTLLTWRIPSLDTDRGAGCS